MCVASVPMSGLHIWEGGTLHVENHPNVGKVFKDVAGHKD